MSEKKTNSEGKQLSRRDFLRNTGILAGGAVLGGTLLTGCNTPAAAPPAAPPAESTQKWDYETDVIVCGTGPAGLACAAAAAEAGVKVIAIDANDKIGGKGILAGGNLGIGGGTRMQIAAGFEETAEIIYEDRTVPNLRTDMTMVVETIDGREVEMGQWRKISGAEDGEGMSRAFADNSLDTWNWLDGMGVPFIKANVSKMSAVYRGSRYYTTTSPRLVDRENGKEGDMQVAVLACAGQSMTLR